ncbi:hypothetical protein ACFQ8C_23290 [Streptomyces sp. NPDC056503]|uniref:hypothetical protein n=1 Tax=Streptomyces sp. NPDC056503 TaxID=3345842 RepID=UPI0036BE5C6D
MKKRTLLLSSLGAVLLAGGGATWYAAHAAANAYVLPCFGAPGGVGGGGTAPHSRLLLAGTVREVGVHRRPGAGGGDPERVVRARLVVDSVYKHAVPTPHGFAAGTTVEVEQAGGPRDGFRARLSEGRRYTVSLFPWTSTEGTSFDVDAAEETPDRAAGDARWRVAAADGERLPDPCEEQDRRFREEYGVGDVFLEWLT